MAENGTVIFAAWSDELSVGDERIDKQHQKLLFNINLLYFRIQRNEAKEHISELLDILNQYTEKHFNYEESLLKKINFPDSDAHTARHKDFKETCYKLSQDYRNSSALITDDIMLFLKDWWINHIQKEDKKYSVYIKCSA